MMMFATRPVVRHVDSSFTIVSTYINNIPFDLGGWGEEDEGGD